MLLFQYKNPEITKKDIVSVLNQYGGLQLKQETYGKLNNCYVQEVIYFSLLVFNDGTPMELVNLSGTIPVTYKGKLLMN